MGRDTGACYRIRAGRVYRYDLRGQGLHFDGVMGSVRGPWPVGDYTSDELLFSQVFRAYRYCTMAMAAVLGFLFPGTRGNSISSGKTNEAAAIRN